MDLPLPRKMLIGQPKPVCKGNSWAEAQYALGFGNIEAGISSEKLESSLGQRRLFADNSEYGFCDGTKQPC